MLRVLFLTHRLPYAPNRGDRLRAYHMLCSLAGNAQVDLVSLVHDDDEARQTAALAGLAHSVRVARVPRLRNLSRVPTALPASTPLTHVLLDAPDVTPALAATLAHHRPDVVFAYCSSMARFAMEPPLAGIPFVLDMVDADSAKWRDLAAVSAWPRSWVYAREARVLGAFEARAMRTAVSTLVVTERERNLLAALAPDADIRVMENGVDLAAFERPAADGPSKDVVFCGVLDYEPNAAGASWLARDVWPLVRSRHPDATLTLVGARPTAAVQALASDALAITVTGSVPDVRPYLWRAAIATAPLWVARGVQNKALEAVAAGLPCIVTPPVWEGLPDEIRPGCLVAADPRSFADTIDRLLHSPDERRRISAHANVAALGWSTRLAGLLPLLSDAARRRHPA